MTDASRHTGPAPVRPLRHRGADWVVLAALITACGLLVMSVAASGADHLDRSYAATTGLDGAGTGH